MSRHSRLNVFLAENEKWSNVGIMNELKANLRRRIIRDLRNLSPAQIKSGSLLMRRRLSVLLKEEQAKRSNSPLKVAAFAARSYELDLLPLVKLMPEIEWYFPQCERKREMVFRRVKNPSLDLVEGFKGIREPSHELPLVAPHELDIVITPGAGFSMDGRRLGFGGGFYDTFFAKGVKALKMGVCLPCQIYDEIPSEAHDFSVDFVVVAGKCAPWRK